jgi:K+-sensing histidine kinase KdpD
VDTTERVATSMDDELPLVRADANMLERVVLNVAENAVRPGLPKDATESIFKPFRRLCSAPGVGLGRHHPHGGHAGAAGSPW